MSDKEQMAILRLREASEMSLSQYKKPLLITSSGGKDSSVCVELARRAGIPLMCCITTRPPTPGNRLFCPARICTA